MKKENPVPIIGTGFSVIHSQIRSSQMYYGKQNCHPWLFHGYIKVDGLLKQADLGQVAQDTFSHQADRMKLLFTQAGHLPRKGMVSLFYCRKAFLSRRIIMEVIIIFFIMSGFFYSIYAAIWHKQPKRKPMAEVKKRTGPRIQRFAPSPFAISGIDYDIPAYIRKGIELDFNKKPSKQKRTPKRAQVQSSVSDRPEMATEEAQEPQFEVIA